MNTDNTNRLPSRIRLREKPEGKFCWQDNETYDVFQRIIGPHGTALYATLSRKCRDGKLEYSVRGLASITAQSASNVARKLKVLEHVGMVRLTSRGGNSQSLCELFNLKDRIQSWGTKQDQERVIERLTCEVKDLQKKLVGKEKPKQTSKLLASGPVAPQRCENLLSPASKRDTGVPPEARQRRTRETQTGTHLLIQERRIEEAPSPTPSPNMQALQEPKGFSNEDGPDKNLKWARDRFNGVMDDMRAHILDTSRRPAPHLANGYAEWEEFGFNRLAVEAAAWRGEVLVLMLSASDPAAARRGVERYHRTWNPSLRKWYGCEVHVEWQEAMRKG